MATFTVTNTNDSGTGSLREAVDLANANADADTITFDASLSGQTITLTGGELVLTQDVTIDGDVNGDNKADITISGNDASRVFRMTGATTDVDLLSLALTNGFAAGYSGYGGAIYAFQIATLDIQDTTIRDSAAYVGGGLFAHYTDVTLTNSLVTGNAATLGGGIYVWSLSALTVTNSTIHGNTANSSGGGISAGFSAVTLVNSTVTGNQADAGGSDTALGGGLHDTSSTFTVINSVVAENTSGTSAVLNDVNGTIDTATNSVFGTAVTITTNTGSLTGVADVGLGALADNGGTVETRLALSGSVLIDAGDDASAPAGDAANGLPRIVGDHVDIGAAESIPATLVVDEAGDVVDGNYTAGNLSLREAVNLANMNADANTITFASSLAGQTITLTGGELTLTQDVTIDGDTDGDNKADITISGNDASRVFRMTGGSTDVDLLSLTLTNGSSTGHGGAVYASSIGTLDIQDTTIRNSVSGDGGGLVASATDVTLTNSLVTGNSANSFGGGIYVRTGSTLTVTSSTIHGNITAAAGGGISAITSTVTLLNSTVTGNQADADGGSTTRGGGIDDFGSTITVINSVVAENTSGTSMTANDVNGTIDTSTNSVFGTRVSGVTNGVNGNLTGVADVGLGALADNGGTVMTRNIESGSVLINAGSNAAASSLATDANGNDRITFGTVDVGATEFNGPLVVTTASDVVDANDGLLSLREAITLANANADADVITFGASLGGQTITLTGGELVLTQDVIIDGDTDGDHKADITISGNDASRVFRMTGGSTDVDLLSLTLTNGFSAIVGGAIYASSIGTLDIQDTTINDSAASHGGGLLAHNTDVTLTNSLVTGNSAGYFGGGVYVRLSSTLAVTNSTIHGNTANGKGGGITAASSSVTLLNSTVTGNQADADGSVTTLGGGIDDFGSTITVTNSVVAENTSGTSMTASDVSGTIDTADHSFFGTTVTTGSGSGNLNGAGDPMLGELLDNGGTVLSRSPLDGSPLIGAGSNALLPADVFDIDHDGDTAETLPLDGRDGLRLVGGTVDIGTVEQIADEVINGTPGRNIVIGGLGVDILNGRGGRDTVRGGDDDDTVYGGRGVDLVSGNGGRDKLNGGKGEDTLNGGADGDILTGGADADVFQFNNVAHSAQGPGLSDTIKDFTQGEDVMDLANAFAFTFMGETEFTGVAGELIQRTSGSDVLVLGDTDGDTRTDFRIILEGVAGITLTVGDFVL